MEVSTSVGGPHKMLLRAVVCPPLVYESSFLRTCLEPAVCVVVILFGSTAVFDIFFFVVVPYLLKASESIPGVRNPSWSRLEATLESSAPQDAANGKYASPI